MHIHIFLFVSDIIHTLLYIATEAFTLNLINFDYVAFYFIFLYWHESVEFSYNALKEMESFTFIWTLFRLWNVCFRLTPPTDKRTKRSMRVTRGRLQCYLWISTIGSTLQYQVVEEYGNASTQSCLISFLDRSQRNLIFALAKPEHLY